MMTELQPCGTTGAFLRHKRNGEEPCGPCAEARRTYAREFARKNKSRTRERNLEAGRQWRLRNLETARSKDRLKWHKLTPEQKWTRRRTQLLRKYGITHAEYNALLLAQDSKCASCGTVEPGAKGWCIDHDHSRTSESVRGILCVICNVVLGMMGDDLSGASRYEWAMGVRYLKEVVPVTRARLRAIRHNPAPSGADCGEA